MSRKSRMMPKPPLSNAHESDQAGACLNDAFKRKIAESDSESDGRELAVFSKPSGKRTRLGK